MFKVHQVFPTFLCLTITSYKSPLFYTFDWQKNKVILTEMMASDLWTHLDFGSSYVTVKQMFVSLKSDIVSVHRS